MDTHKRSKEPVRVSGLKRAESFGDRSKPTDGLQHQAVSCQQPQSKKKRSPQWLVAAAEERTTTSNRRREEAVQSRSHRLAHSVGGAARVDSY